MTQSPKITLLDSISYISAEHEGQIIISGSHGGSAAGRYALAHPPFLVVFNDAGVGNDEAGIVALWDLEQAGIAAVTVSHNSARSGEANDTWENGRVSHVNRLAKKLGIQVEEMVKTAVVKIAKG